MAGQNAPISVMDQKPFISKQSVRAVLDGMLYGTSASEKGALEYLTVVDNYLDEHDIPQAEERRQFAIRSLLNERIIRNLVHHRNNFGLLPPADSDTLSTAQRAIKSDGRVSSSELIGWSALYYRYVRADLNITLADFARSVHSDERTLRRYQAHALGLLRDDLIANEALARRDYRRLKLRAAIPGGIPAPVIGRDEHLTTALELLDSTRPRHLQITGAPGVGKTTFVKLVLQDLIEREEIDDLVWIDEPDTIKNVRQSIQQAILFDKQDILEERLLHRRVTFVFDGLQRLARDRGALQLLLRDLSQATIFLVNVVYVGLSSDCPHFVLPQVDKNSVAKIIQAARLQDKGGAEVDEYMDELWEGVGGNPLAIKLSINQLNNVACYFPLEPGRGSLMRILLASYESLTLGARRVLIMYTLLPDRPHGLRQVRRIWPEYTLTDEHLVELLSCGLLRGTADSGLYTLEHSVKIYVQELGDSHPEIQLIVDELLYELDRGIVLDSKTIFEAAENILRFRWPALSQSREAEWVEELCVYGVTQGHFAIWEAIISNIATPDGELGYATMIAYAVCQRRLIRWSASESILGKMIENSGRKGAFVWQGRGLLEYGILLRYQGLHERAAGMLSRAESIARRNDDNDLLASVQIEQAQIALEAGMYGDVLSLLSEISHDNGRVLSLLSEADAALGRFDLAREYAEEAMLYFDGESQDVGRLYSNLGRIYLGQDDMQVAEHCFAMAVTVLERADDRFALARAKSNLGAVLVQMHRDYDDARRLLIEAEAAQSDGNDRVGLIYTRHNLDELDRYMVDAPQDSNTIGLD